MASGSSDTQVVFLIDVCSFESTDHKWKEAISLCVFRVLCFLNLQTTPSNPATKPGKQRLKWGYKFFNSDGQKTRMGAAQSSFREFKLKYFEEFERNLENVIESDTPVRTRSKQNQTPATKSSAGSTYPALSVSKSLTELIHDFQWETLDIGSPIKTRKSTASHSSGYGDGTNLVFLFSRVPCDRKALRHFSNKVVMDADVFTESLMSTMLQKEFCVHRKIKLFWIDTGRYFPPDFNESKHTSPPDKKSFDIVKQSVKKLGGNLLLFDTLVTHLPGTQTAFDQLATGTGDECRGRSSSGFSKRRDIATILSGFSLSSACSALVVHSSELDGKAGSSCWCDCCSGLQDTFSEVHLLLQDERGSLNVPLDLIPIVKKSSTCEQRKPLQTINLSTQSGVHTAFTVSSHVSGSASVVQDQGDGCRSAVIQPRARIERAQACLLGNIMMCHFLCHLQPSASAAERQKFSELLCAVHRDNQCLVLSVCCRGVAAPFLALLEATSPSSAHLSLLSLAVTLQVEKLISHQLQGQHADRDDSILGISLEEFKRKAVAAVKLKSRHVGDGDDAAVSADSDRVGGKFTAGMLNSWHSPACAPHLLGALGKLKERIGDMDYLSDAVLLDLQSAYRKENQQPVLLQPSHHSTPTVSSAASAPQPGSREWMNISGESGSTSQDRPGLSRQSSLLARGLLMLSKAKQTPNLPADEVDGDYVPSTQPDAVSRADVSGLVPAHLQSIEDLQKFVQEQYKQAVNSGLGLEMTAQSLVTVIQHFMTTQPGQTQPQNSAAQFVVQNVSKTSKDLKALYQNLDSDEGKRKKVTEYKLQVLLRLEMESVCASLQDSEMERTTNEIVDLLRGLLFITETGAVPKFLNTAVVTNYSATLPQLLVNIYEELMQPLPPALAEFMSPGTTPSVISGPLSASSQLSCAPNSDPNSTQSNPSLRPRTRSLRPYPSLTGFGSKRQIVVQAQAGNKKSKPKTEPKPKAADGHKSSRHKIKAEVKRARRNLFDSEDKKKVDRRPAQPTSVDAPKKTTPKKSTPRKRSHRSMTFSPTGGSVPRMKIVAETPHHRRPSRTSWLQQQQHTENQDAVPDAHEVQVVAESPVKACSDLKASPGRYKPAMRIMRKAFYSAGQEHRSRNLARALELSDRIAGRQRHRRGLSGATLADALSGNGQEEILSPTRQASAFLRAQLMKSPSPSLSTPTKPHPQQPDFTSPSQNTRSKTPQKLPFPRLRLFQSGEETPSSSVSSPAIAALDFTSPVKRQSVPLVAETPPRLTRAQSATLVMNTPTKPDGSIGQTTPKKAGMSSVVRCTTPKRVASDSSGYVTPKRCQARSGSHTTPPKVWTDSLSNKTPTKSETSTSLHHSKESGTPKKGKVRTAPRKTDTEQFEMISPSKRSRRHSQSLEFQGGSRHDKSPITQSTILDYISPKSKGSRVEDKPNHPSAQRDVHLEPGQGTPTRSTRRACLEERHAWPGAGTRRNLMSNTPTKVTGESSQLAQGATDSNRMSLRAGLLSPVRTPTKFVMAGQSPTKTPTKPILKNSPSVRTLSSPPGFMGASRTPQKSPRVTFDLESKLSSGARGPQSPTASSSRDLRTPDLDKWPRKKRRRPSDSKSPTSQSPTSSPANSDESNHQLSLSKPECVQAGGSGHDRTLAMEPSVHSTEVRSRVMRKRGSLFSDSESIFSPSKRRRTDTAGRLSGDEPSLFSDNAVDSLWSYFSASNDDVFLSAISKDAEASGRQRVGGSSEQSSHASGVGSPQFRGKTRSSIGLKRCKSSFADEGSQGFEIRSQDSKPPASPTFSTSPVLRKSRTKDHEAHSGSSRQQLHAEDGTLSSSHAQSGPSTPTEFCSPQAGSSKLTPLRIKGTPMGRKFSPTVSTTSLVHLMNSPILFDNPKHKKDGDCKQPPEHGSSPTKPVRKKSRKMLHLQD